ncbi:MAG: UDP-N-acetylmuramoyl-L-alanyl-D-glutamate--2,6-diaminopimelate ligase [Pseudomonadota bacterium]
MTRPADTRAWAELAGELRALAPNARAMTADSRKVGPGDVFLAHPGAVHDGRSHIVQAIQAGAAAVVWEPDGWTWNPDWRAPHLPVAGLRQGAAHLAAAWYGAPSEHLWMTGVTGTNGKTSVAQWLAAAWSRLGRPTATIGTVGNGFLDEAGRFLGADNQASHTTPDPVTLQGLLARFRDQGAAGVAMEVSSHGLDQGRVEGVAFDVAVFTNLSRDHLDYHGDMAAYAAAKSRLFRWPGLQWAVLNEDDELGARLGGELRGGPVQVLGYGFAAGDVLAESCQADRLGLRLEIVTPWGRGRLTSALLGRFNAYNLLAALGALLAGGAPLDQALAVLGQVRPAAGRMQRVPGPADAPTVIVDFAHTPDALDKVLAALKPLTPGRLWCVFGCGGGRDTGKRPLMGAAVAAGADVAIVTSDNPRNEDPMQIIDGILAGMPPGQTVEPDRRAAIRHAILAAGPEDIVVLAGKGHEDYQEVHGVKHPFSDAEEARLALTQRSGA